MFLTVLKIIVKSTEKFQKISVFVRNSFFNNFRNFYRHTYFPPKQPNSCPSHTLFSGQFFASSDFMRRNGRPSPIILSMRCLSVIERFLISPDDTVKPFIAEIYQDITGRQSLINMSWGQCTSQKRSVGFPAELTLHDSQYCSIT